MSGKVYLTRKKYKELLSLLEKMKKIDRREISKEIEIAREKGDLRENAEYDAAKEKQGHIEAKIADLESKLSRAEMVDDLDLDMTKINISAKVVIEDVSDNTQISYELVGPDESDFDEGKISVTSPVGSAFLGHIRYDNTGHVEVDFSKHTGHIHSNDKNLIVGDGGGVIKLWKWNGKSYDGPRVLCEHKSSMKTQHSHPHPRFNATGDKVLYTTDRSGYCNVYQVDLKEFESLPMVEE
jgi:transcription elongation factor GreA